MPTVRVRDAVFETNSSSSHSVTVAEGEMHDATLPPDMLKAGRIDVSLGEYGREFKRYYRPENKLAYILTQLAEDVPSTRSVCRTVEEHTGCRVVIDASSRESSYMDHQSEGVGLDLVADPARLVFFLFSPESYVQTGCDESTPGEFIETDRGPEECHADAFVDEIPSEASFSLSFPYGLDTATLEIDGETIVSSPGYGARHELFRALDGAVVAAAVVSSREQWHRIGSIEAARNIVLDLLSDMRRETGGRTVHLHRDALISPETSTRRGAFALDHVSTAHFEIVFAAPAATAERTKAFLAGFAHVAGPSA